MNYIIESDRLLLRQFRIDDAEAYYKMTRDDAIRKYVEYACPFNFSEAVEDITFCYSRCDFVRDYYLILENKHTHQIIGAIIATEGANRNTLDMCILIESESRRKGYMTEALQKFISVLPKNKVLNFWINNKNIASLNTVGKIPGILRITNIDENNLYSIFHYVV